MERLNTNGSTKTRATDRQFYLPAMTSQASDGGRLGRFLAAIFGERGELRARVRPRN